MNNFDFSAIVSKGEKGENIISGDDCFSMLLCLSSYWGARIERLECDIPQFADSDGMEECICIPIERNNINVSELNNVNSRLSISRCFYPNRLGTHKVSPLLTKDIVDIRKSLGYNNFLVGMMMPSDYQAKRKRK